MFRDEYGNIYALNISKEFLIGAGVFGEVYRINENTCFKMFKSRSDIDIIEANIKYIMDLQQSGFDTSNIYEILNRIYVDDCFIGYTMKYYENKDLFTFNRKYLFENYYKIQELFRELASHGIYFSDLHKNNMLLSNEGIILIDADFINMTYDTLEAYNRAMSLLNCAIRELLFKYGTINGYSKEDIQKLYIEFQYFKDNFDCDEPILIK